MARQIIVLVVGAVLVSSTSVASHMNCQEFGFGVQFNSSQAVGTWHSIASHRAGTYPAKCAKLSAVSSQEKEELRELIGPFVMVLWDNLELKLSADCLQAQEKYDENTEYYLERLASDGAYMTLQLPNIDSVLLTVTTICPQFGELASPLDSYDYNRHLMRLKLVADSLAIMDCEDNYIFILSRQPNRRAMDPDIVKALKTYLPEDDD